MTAIKLPKHIHLSIEHQPHAVCYESAQEWMDRNDRDGFADVEPEDAELMISTGEIWVVQWYPNTPIGFCAVAAATLERALELAASECEGEQ